MNSVFCEFTVFGKIVASWVSQPDIHIFGFVFASSYSSCPCFWFSCCCCHYLPRCSVLSRHFLLFSISQSPLASFLPLLPFGLFRCFSVFAVSQVTVFWFFCVRESTMLALHEGLLPLPRIHLVDRFSQSRFQIRDPFFVFASAAN